jgi:short-subunit dehydrogenase
MDVTKEDNLEHFKQILEEKKPTICILVNCAGYGIRKAFIEGNYQEELGMIDINCRSLTAITYLCIPYMHKGSRILQIASAAAFLPQGGFAVYSASKAYVLSFSRALHKELRTKGIGVTAVCPGPVDTDFFSISDAGGSMPVWKKLFLAKTNRVVAKALEDSKRKKSVSMYGFAIHALRFITRFYS